MNSGKEIKCSQCQHRVTLITRIDKEGFFVQYGWNVLRDHHNRHHPDYIAAVDAWIDGEAEHGAPHDSEEACLG